MARLDLSDIGMELRARAEGGYDLDTRVLVESLDRIRQAFQELGDALADAPPVVRKYIKVHVEIPGVEDDKP